MACVAVAALSPDKKANLEAVSFKYRYAAPAPIEKKPEPEHKPPVDPWTLEYIVPYRPPEPFHIFEEYSFEHRGKTMFIYYNIRSCDIALARTIGAWDDPDMFGTLMQKDMALIATLAIRRGSVAPRVTIHRPEALYDKRPLQAMAVIIHRKFPFLSFEMVPVLSELLGDKIYAFDVFLNI